MKMKKLALFSAMFLLAVKGAGASELEDLGSYLSDPLTIDLSETKAPGQNGSFGKPDHAIPNPGHPQVVHPQPSHPQPSHPQPGHGNDNNWNHNNNHNNPGHDNHNDWNNNHNNPGHDNHNDWNNNHNNPGHDNHNDWNNNHNYPGHDNNGWHDGYPVYPPYPPYPPVPPNNLKTFSFQSGEFTFNSDAETSRMYAERALRNAGYFVFQSGNNFRSYTLLFQAPSHARIEKHQSGVYTFGSDAQKAADECKAALERLGMVILEKNLQGTRFTVSYLSTRYYLQSQSFMSGVYTFGSDASAAMREAASAMSGHGIAVLEKRLNGTSYTLVFLADYTVRVERYDSHNFTFSSDAQRAADETAMNFKRNGMIVLEKNVRGTRFSISYFRPLVMNHY